MQKAGARPNVATGNGVKDAADYIETPADVAGFLALAFADNDPDEIRDAIAVVARSRGMATLAAKAKLNPKSLYRTLGPNGNPEFGTCSASSRRSASRSRQPSSHHARAPRAKPRDCRAKFAKFWQIVHTTGPAAKNAGTPVPNLIRSIVLNHLAGQKQWNETQSDQLLAIEREMRKIVFQ